ATVLARNKGAQAALLAEFRAGRAQKEYRALVQGRPLVDEGAVELAVAGVPAATRYRVLERFAKAGGAALVDAFPETGRTHQIRIHFASLGHPLLGDARYGGPRALTAADGARLEVRRPLLHARRL